MTSTNPEILPIPLDHEQRAALLRYAKEQDRDPRFQAALFIRRGLEQAGVIPTSERPTAPESGGGRGIFD